MKAVHWIILGIVIAFATYFIYQTRETGTHGYTINLNWKFHDGGYRGSCRCTIRRFRLEISFPASRLDD